MKKKILELLFIMYTLASCYSQDLVPFSYMGNIGYLNQKMEIVIYPQYDYGSNFEDGYAIVKKQNRYQIIDNHNEILYSTGAVDLNQIGDSYFVEQDSSYRIIDVKSKDVIAENLQSVQWDGEGNTDIIAAVYGNETQSSYINNNGEILFEGLLLNKAYSFNQGVATVLTDDWQYAILDLSGNLLFKDFRRLGKRFSEGLCPAQMKDGSTGYVDTTGNFVFEIPLVVSNEMGYTNKQFKDGLSIINCIDDEDYWVIIDNKGNYISERIRADQSFDFYNGMARIHKYSYENDEHIYGFVNSNGDLIYDYQFSSADDFCNGFSRVITQDGKEAIIDKEGNIFFSSDLVSDRQTHNPR